MTIVERHQHAPGSGPEPGDVCKHCGAELTWTGPSAYDFIAVDDQSRTVTPFPYQGRTRTWAGTAANHSRVEHARAAVRAFAAETGRARAMPRGHDLGEDILLEVVGDLVSDLMHLAASEGIDPHDVINRSRMHLDAEHDGREDTRA